MITITISIFSFLMFLTLGIILYINILIFLNFNYVTHI